MSDEERREFLKALGVGGAVAVGGTTLDEVRQSLDAAAGGELASIGRAIRADLHGSIDLSTIGEHEATLQREARALPAVVEKGFPTDEPRDDFASVAAAAGPVCDHLADVGFFESTTEHLPEFTPESLHESVESFAASEALAEPLADLDFAGTDGVDLLAEVVSNAEAISQYHWVATDQIPRGEIEIGEQIPPMTRAAAGGVVLWLEDLDAHLWQMRALLTDEILEAASWHAQSMAAGFQLMTAGAKAIAAESGTFSDGELGALLSTGFAVQTIAQNLLPGDVYWITEEMRGERRTDLNTITE